MNRTTPRKHESTKSKAAPLTIALAMIFAAGCATKANPTLEDARTAYQRASSDAHVTKNAPVSLHEAQVALKDAEKAFEKGNKKDTDALSYVAIRRVEIAEELADKNLSQQEMEGQGQRRAEVLLEARDAELAALKAKKTDRGLLITLDDVLFEFGRAELKAGAVRGLDRLVSLMKEYPERNLLIEGHTDSVGSDAANTVLSQKRADAVTNALQRAGIDRARITTRGLSEAFPVATNSTPAGRQQNRRVEILILPEGQSGRLAAR